MARTPSMSPAQAHDECVSAYGPRGGPKQEITTENRHYVRRWLTASGMSSDYARALPNSALNALWNDVSGNEWRMHMTAAANGRNAPVIEHQPVATPATTLPEITHMPAPTNTDAAAQIAAGLQALLGSQPIDESAVRAIVDQRVKGTEDALLSVIEESIGAIRSQVENIKPVRSILVVQTPDGQNKGELPAARHPQCESLLKIVAAGVPAYVVGPAGSGKTTAAEQVAEALGMTFYTQGAATGTHEFLGFIDAHGAYQTTPFRHAFEHGGVFLADEIDSSDPAVLLVINSALANGVMAFPDRAEPVRRHESFRFIAAANTFGQGADREYVGRNQLDAATLDRFAFLEWGYDEALETALCGNEMWARRVQDVRKAVASLKLRHVVSPRASIQGARLLTAGLDREAVADMVIWKGMNEGDRTRVKSALREM